MLLPALLTRASDIAYGTTVASFATLQSETNMKLFRKVGAVSVLIVSAIATADDVSDVPHKSQSFGAWTLITFLFPKEIAYRVYQNALNSDTQTLTFDLGSESCGTTTSQMTITLLWPGSIGGFPLLPFRYKLHGTGDEMVAQTSESGGFVFARFGTSFPLEKLRDSHDGMLAISISPPHDHPEFAGPNLYFDTKGFKDAYMTAIKECVANRGSK